MFRVCLTIVLPLLLPTGLYVLWVGASGAAREGGLPWATMPWVWLASAGAMLLAVVLFVVTVGFGARQEGVYIAPRWQSGHIIPGHVEPKLRD